MSDDLLKFTAEQLREQGYPEDIVRKIEKIKERNRRKRWTKETIKEGAAYSIATIIGGLLAVALVWGLGVLILKALE